jgi:hypothetical protein
MPCTSPFTVSFKADGKTLNWSQKNHIKEHAAFQIPCGQCISCRLDYAREWATRCVLESSQYENNCFLTLTYDDDHLGDNRLRYRDFQLFMKKLRKLQNEPIGFMVTGEYGERTKRAHWHAIIFNWRPRDAQKKYITDLNCQVYESETLNKTWGNGIAEFGDVTFQSAAYVARYSIKKLTHKDESDFYKPIHKKSSLHAIGKKYIEQHYKHVFNRGSVVLPGGITAPIPRYFIRWLREHRPEDFIQYLMTTKSKQLDRAAQKQQKEVSEYLDQCFRGSHAQYVISPRERKRRFAAERLKFLHQNEKD